MSNPIAMLKKWLEEEIVAGAPNPQQAILSTVSLNAVPHARVVAIREVDEKGLLFFTQKQTKKVSELLQTPKVALTFWFELLQREVIIEGSADFLTEFENNVYWQTYPREAQIRFCSYAPTSSKPIKSKDVLEGLKKELEQQYESKTLPLSKDYCGVRIQPAKMIFYAYRVDELSDVMEYTSTQTGWMKQCLSP